MIQKGLYISVVAMILSSLAAPSTGTCKDKIKTQMLSLLLVIILYNSYIYSLPFLSITLSS